MAKNKLNLHPDGKKAIILRYFAEGYTKAQIARSLNVHPTTVEKWVKELKLEQDYQELHYPND